MNDLTALSRNTQSYLETYNNIVSRMASRLETAPTDRSVSGSFLRHTLPMQEAAGEMCRNLLRYTTSLDLQRLADDVLTRQAHALEALRRPLLRRPFGAAPRHGVRPRPKFHRPQFH